ncbi:hypothetical protein [Roseateles chitinivorans]|uniref:hypothetical protein n=1 Tax=Roseateles chitinivorans TaxID=2917965 RepID=UPI003D678948
MDDITKDMLRFKEAARHVWNAYLLNSGSPMSPEIQESFHKIELELLRALVLLPAGMPDVADDYRRVPLPINLRAKGGLTDVPMQYGTIDEHQNTQWELPRSIDAAEISHFRFFEFFDWNPYGHVDFGHVRAWTANGRPVLVEQIYCDFTAAGQVTGLR